MKASFFTSKEFRFGSTFLIALFLFDTLKDVGYNPFLILIPIGLSLILFLYLFKQVNGDWDTFFKSEPFRWWYIITTAAIIAPLVIATFYI